MTRVNHSVQAVVVIHPLLLTGRMWSSQHLLFVAPLGQILLLLQDLDKSPDIVGLGTNLQWPLSGI